MTRQEEELAATRRELEELRRLHDDSKFSAKRTASKKNGKKVVAWKYAGGQEETASSARARMRAMEDMSTSTRARLAQRGIDPAKVGAKLSEDEANRVTSKRVSPKQEIDNRELVEEPRLAKITPKKEVQDIQVEEVTDAIKAEKDLPIEAPKQVESPEVARSDSQDGATLQRPSSVFGPLSSGSLSEDQQRHAARDTVELADEAKEIKEYVAAKQPSSSMGAMSQSSPSRVKGDKLSASAALARYGEELPEEESVENLGDIANKEVGAEKSESRARMVAPKQGGSECNLAEKEMDQAATASESADKLFHYRRALRLCPSNPVYHNALGELYQKLRRTSDAKFEYQEALNVDPAFSKAKSNLESLQGN